MWRDSFWVGIAQIVAIPIGIATMVIMTKCLSLNDFGLYQLVFSYIAVAKITTLPGMTKVIQKGAVKGYDAIFHKAITLSFYASLIGSLVFFLSAIYVITFKSNSVQLGYLLIISGIFFPIFAFEKCNMVLVGKRKFRLSRLLIIISGILSLIIIGSTAYITKSLFYTFIAGCLSQAIMIIMIFFVTKKQLNYIDEDKVLEKKLLHFGWKMTSLDILGFIVDKIDTIIIGVINPGLLAIYHIGNRIPETLKANAKVLLTIPTMHWSALDKKQNIIKIKKYWWVFLILGGIGSVAIWILSPWFITTFFGKKYAESAFVSRWLSIVIGPMFLTNVIGNIDIFQDEGKYFRRITVTTQIIYLILLFILVKYKIPGVIISVVITEFISFFAFVGYFLYLSRRLDL